MTGRLRVWLFWIHLGLGVVMAIALVPIAATGALLAFERETIAWLEQDAELAELATDAIPLAPSELVRRVSPQLPAAKLESVELIRDRRAPAVVRTDRGSWLVDPYTGQPLREARARGFFHTVELVHRSVGLELLDRWELGTTLAGIAAIGLTALSLTGPFLWWPRKPSRAQLRRRLWFSRSRTSTARDFDWHHVFGIWCTPVLLAASFTGVLICFDGARDLVTTVLGKAPEGLRNVDADAAVREAPRLAPDYTALRVRWGKGGTNVRVRFETGTRPTHWATVVRHDDDTLALRRYDDGRPGDRVLGWARWLHTGQALGLLGQATWGAATLGLLVLIGTGSALSLRRLRRARAKL